MARPTVRGFVIDDDNAEKFAYHGVAEFQVAQVLEDEFYIGPNKREHRASHVVVGYDYGGACLTVPIAPTHQPTIWRPVTAWYSTPSERARRDRQRRRD
jgi:hypothetical protein